MQVSQPLYAPSWVDRLIDWIRELPLPAWLFYVFLYLVAALAMHAMVWIDRVVPLGQIQFEWLFNGIWVAISLAFIHMLESTADRAVDQFATLVPKKRKQLEIYRYRMTTMPAKPVFWMTLVMAVILGVVVVEQPSVYYEGLSNPLTIIMGIIMLGFSYSLAPVLFYQGWRLLKNVTEAYNLVDNLNIYHQQPLYSFSGLTLQASLFWILLANLGLLNLVLTARDKTAETVINYGLDVLLLLLAFATFLVPLWGTHQRLVRAKQDVLQENSLQIDKAQRKLYRAIDKESNADITKYDNAISSLYRVRTQLKAAPTWPWAAGTLRNFLSAVFLPLIVWALQLFLARYLGG